MTRANNRERQQNIPITQQLNIRKEQGEQKKKKSEKTLQKTEANESHPKFIEMRKLKNRN